MTKRCIVTGGLGFIGSHLVDRLISDGHQVTVLDDLSNGRAENLAHLKGHAALRVMRADVASPSALGDAFSGTQWVFHLAALADIVPSVENPGRYHRANVDGTFAVLKAARAAGVQRFVYAASSSCYGIPDQYPTPESAPIRPMYPYALTKALAEHYVLHWAQLYHLPAVSLRLFNVYGPRARTGGTYGAVFGVFLAQLLAGKPLTIVGDGTQSRDFTFVTDVVDAFVRAAQSDIAGQAFNVGTGVPQTVNRLADLLGAEERVHLPKRPGEPDITMADNRRIVRTLGWRPAVSFEEGVAVMLRHKDHWRSAPVWDPQSIGRATEAWFKHLAPSSVKVHIHVSPDDVAGVSRAAAGEPWLNDRPAVEPLEPPETPIAWAA